MLLGQPGERGETVPEVGKTDAFPLGRTRALEHTMLLGQPGERGETVPEVGKTDAFPLGVCIYIRAE
ncbi:hypothetical protein NDU88_001873 [Pleurodeles waltl]|uniref:Uncharacterized protein n=1 Tax=Pleurodeles waltl TaxID=8319 RepID=A0AAV7UBJ6_PLEWA|nr:hypothetical protein NDU88_001873 [Pleurodeles waltl]